MILPHYLQQLSIKAMVQVIPDARDVEEVLRDNSLGNDDYRERVLADLL